MHYVYYFEVSGQRIISDFVKSLPDEVKEGLDHSKGSLHLTYELQNNKTCGIVVTDADVSDSLADIEGILKVETIRHNEEIKDGDILVDKAGFTITFVGD